MKSMLEYIVSRVIHSRRVMLLVAALIVASLTLWVPDLAPLRDELFTVVAVFMLVLITGVNTQDAAEIAKESAPTYADYDLRDLLREVVQEVLGEVLGTDE